MARPCADGTNDARSYAQLHEDGSASHCSSARLSLLAVAGCAHRELIPGNNVADTEVNREIVKTVEDYRPRIESRDVERLLMLALSTTSRTGDAPTGRRLSVRRAEEVLNEAAVAGAVDRYSIQYRNIRMVSDREAEVKVRLNGSFELMSESGERYRNIDDFQHFSLRAHRQGSLEVLERDVTRG